MLYSEEEKRLRHLFEIGGYGMTAKEYLKQVKYIERNICKKRTMAQKLRESLCGKSVSYENTGATLQHSCDDALGETVAKVVDYEREADEEIARLVNLRIEIEKAILSIENDKEQEVLERKYLLFENDTQIAEEMECSIRSVYNYHNSGLKKIIVPETDCSNFL